MSARYVLAPKATRDLAEIWSYLHEQAGVGVAGHVESAIREKIVFLTTTPGAGHARPDLTEEDVKFFSVYSYLIVYLPETKPLQVVSILHGRRDIAQILKNRL
ncbi:MAG TPA: type II toxin-antitoxin system RelE/ParE family toxin [Candidatus Acidoferrales bacterium]|nr:type II toxin-antitoxin system RelE/ParE family toxin [Candidatus Acidoferrales bacterium]